MIATFINVFEPASASGVAEPAAIAAALKSSYHLPIIGIIKEVENMPAPPINDKPNAPVFGRYSETNPSIVGQKKQMPAAKTKAAPNAAYPVALLNKKRPIHASNAESISMPL